MVPQEFYSYIPAAEDIPLAADPYAPIDMPLPACTQRLFWTAAMRSLALA